MAFNLDFSSWDAANRALAEGTVQTQTTKSQAKASRASGLMGGIGTVIGAIVGGPAGASIGGSIGSSLSGGGTTPNGLSTDLFSQTTDWYKKSKMPKWQQNMSDSERASIATDPMQVASAMNAITGGDVIDTAVAASKIYGGLI